MANEPKMPALTPIPFESLEKLSRNINHMSSSIIRIETSLGTIKEDLLPPVSKTAFQAKDGLLKLEGRVAVIEDRPLFDHSCKEETRQMRQDNDIAETRTKASGTSKLVWWLMGILIAVGGSAIGFAMFTRTQTTTNSTRIESHAQHLSRHESEINDIEKMQQRDRETYLTELRRLPIAVKKASKTTVDDMEEAADELPLTSFEQRQLIILLNKARKRSNSGKIQKQKNRSKYEQR